MIAGRYAVNSNKQKHIRDTAQVFLTCYPQWADCLMSFDVVEITDGKLEYLENCFYWNKVNNNKSKLLTALQLALARRVISAKAW